MKQLSEINIACVIATHSRIGEAKAQMDIIRELWHPYFKRIDIYHEFNGEKAWYKKPYREDFLTRHAPKPHFEGAAHLIEQGIEHAVSSSRQYDFIVVASADVWIYDPEKMREIISLMLQKNCDLASSFWFQFTCLSTEFFVITPSLANTIFPLNYSKYVNKYKFLKLANSYSQTNTVKKLPWTNIPVVEGIFTWKILKELKGVQNILLIPGRKFVFLHNRFYSKDFFSSHHDATERKKYVSKKLNELLQQKKIRSELLKDIMKQDKVIKKISR